MTPALIPQAVPFAVPHAVTAAVSAGAGGGSGVGASHAVTLAGAAGTSVAATHWELIVRIGVAWTLTFALGFERQLRGAMAGDRTFSLIGASTALIGVMTANGSPTILAGAVTGIGFIGGGLCFRQTVNEHDILHGICTAASIFGAAAIGAACGLGLIKEAVAVTILTLLTLELRHIPGLRALDARRWTGRFHHDEHMGWLQACEQLIPGQRNRAAHHDHDHDGECGDSVGVAGSVAGAAGSLVNAGVSATVGTDAVAIAQQEAAITAATVDVPVVVTGGPRG